MNTPIPLNATFLLWQRRWFVAKIMNRVTDKPMFAFTESEYRPYVDGRKRK